MSLRSIEQRVTPTSWTQFFDPLSFFHLPANPDEHALLSPNATPTERRGLRSREVLHRGPTRRGRRGDLWHRAARREGPTWATCRLQSVEMVSPCRFHTARSSVTSLLRGKGPSQKEEAQALVSSSFWQSRSETKDIYFYITHASCFSLHFFHMDCQEDQSIANSGLLGRILNAQSSRKRAQDADKRG